MQNSAEKIITITLQDLASHGVCIKTNLPAPQVGRALTPAESLALTVVQACGFTGNTISYGQPLATAEPAP